MLTELVVEEGTEERERDDALGFGANEVCDPLSDVFFVDENDSRSVTFSESEQCRTCVNNFWEDPSERPESRQCQPPFDEETHTLAHSLTLCLPSFELIYSVILTAVKESPPTIKK